MSLLLYRLLWIQCMRCWYLCSLNSLIVWRGVAMNFMDIASNIKCTRIQRGAWWDFRVELHSCHLWFHITLRVFSFFLNAWERVSYKMAFFLSGHRWKPKLLWLISSSIAFQLNSARNKAFTSRSGFGISLDYLVESSFMKAQFVLTVFAKSNKPIPNSPKVSLHVRCVNIAILTSEPVGPNGVWAPTYGIVHSDNCHRLE